MSGVQRTKTHFLKRCEGDLICEARIASHRPAWMYNFALSWTWWDFYIYSHGIFTHSHLQTHAQFVNRRDWTREFTRIYINIHIILTCCLLKDLKHQLHCKTTGNHLTQGPKYLQTSSLLSHLSLFMPLLLILSSTFFPLFIHLFILKLFPFSLLCQESFRDIRW